MNFQILKLNKMRKFFKILSYIFIFLILSLGALVITIKAMETQALSKIVKNIVEFKLSSSNHKITLDACNIGRLDKDFYNIKFSGLKIFKKSNKELNLIGSAKDIDITLNTHELSRLKYVPVDVAINRFSFELSKDPDEIEEVTESVLDNLVKMIKSQLFWVGKIEINKSKLGFVIGDRTRFLNISTANMVLNKKQQKLNLLLTYELSNSNKHIHDLNLDLSLVKNRFLNITANLSSLPAHLPISQLSASRFKNLQHAANEILISGNIFHSYDSKKKKHTSVINLTDFSGTLHSQLEEGKTLKIAQSKCFIEILEDYDKLRINNCSLNFGQDSSLNLELLYNKKDMNPKLLELSGNLSNLPVSVIDYITDPESPSATKKFLDEFITTGKISKGNWKIRLDKYFFNKRSLTSSEINGNFHIAEAGFKYEGGHPQLSHLNSQVILNGTTAKFNIISGKVERSNIYDSFVTFDWAKWNDEGINVDCKVKGPVGDFIKYMEKGQVETLKAKGVDLTTLEGVADTHVSVHVPLKKEQKIIVKVQTSSPDFGMKFLNDTVHLKSTNVKGVFNETKLSINGSGLVNGAKANIDFSHNFDDNLDIENTLKADIFLSSSLEPNEFLAIKKGQAHLKLDYTSKKNYSFWNAESDLSNAELYVEKLGIIKPLGKAGHIKYTSSANHNHEEPASFEFKAANGIDIAGHIFAKDKSTKIIVDRLYYGNTKLKAELDFSSDHKNYKIYGSSFDLSASDLGKLLSSGERTTSSNYDIKIDQIILKNHIDIKSFKLNLKCSKDKCLEGQMNSYLGDKRRFFDMLLKPHANHEEWIFTTNNAGAVFGGFGIYENIRSGTMVLKLFNRNKIEKADKIHQYVTYGTVNIKKFATVKTPFMTRLVSFISLPGFMGTITRRNYILFREFNGKFAIDNGIFRIDDGVAEGPYFDFNIRGRVDTNRKVYELKGQVVPSLYGISTIVRKVPIIGQIFSGGRRKGLFGAPFVLRDKY
jgi:hypothetical protein